MARGRSLLDEIEQDALDPNADLPSLLRRCITLGGVTGSESLRTWATLELKGYIGEGIDQLPSYRSVPGVLLLDGATMTGLISGQVVPRNMIPDFARDLLMGDVPFAGPIAELAERVRRGRPDDGLKLSPPGAVDVVAYVNAELHQAENQDSFVELPASQVVERIYWSVSLTSVAGILDVVRTTLVELVAEMRAGTPPGQEVPTREIAEQAVTVAVHGKGHRVTVTNVGSGIGTVSDGGGRTVETAPRRVAYWVGIAAGVIAAVAAVAVIFL